MAVLAGQMELFEPAEDVEPMDPVWWEKLGFNSFEAYAARSLCDRGLRVWAAHPFGNPGGARRVMMLCGDEMWELPYTTLRAMEIGPETCRRIADQVAALIWQSAADPRQARAAIGGTR